MKKNSSYFDMFRDFYASKRLTQVSNNNTISVPSLTPNARDAKRESSTV